jgi:hypothetical protein
MGMKPQRNDNTNGNPKNSEKYCQWYLYHNKTRLAVGETGPPRWEAGNELASAMAPEFCPEWLALVKVWVKWCWNRFSSEVFGFHVLITISPLSYTRLSPHHVVCDSPEEAVRYHTLGPQKLGIHNWQLFLSNVGSKPTSTWCQHPNAGYKPIPNHRGSLKSEISLCRNVKQFGITQRDISLTGDGWICTSVRVYHHLHSYIWCHGSFFTSDSSLRDRSIG